MLPIHLKSPSPLLSLHAVESGVDHAAQEIRTERARLIQLAGAPIEMDEDILNHVLSRGLILSDQERCPKGSCLVTRYQALEPANIAVFQAANGLQVFHVWLHACGSFTRHEIYNYASKKVGLRAAYCD